MIEYSKKSNEYVNYNSSTSDLYKPVKTGPICRRTCCSPPNFKCSCGAR